MHFYLQQTKLQFWQLLSIFIFLTTSSFAQESKINFFVRGISTMQMEVFLNGEKVSTLNNKDHLECFVSKKGIYNFDFKLKGSTTDRITIHLKEMKDQFFIMRNASYAFKEADKYDWEKISDNINNVVTVNYFAPKGSEKVKGIEKVERDYSLLKFYTKSSIANNNSVFEFFLNDRLVGTIRRNEILSCKLYSEGRVKISYLVGNLRKTGILDIANNVDEYYTLDRFDGDLDKLSQEEFNNILSREVKDTVFFEEDKTNPIGKLESKKKPSQGSGFLVSNEGYVVTNFHVIEDAEEISIRGIKNDYETTFSASVVAVDATNDLALLKINSSLIQFDSPPYAFKSSKEVNQGEKVFTLGYPIQKLMGNEIKITDGIINSKSGYKGSISEFQFSAVVQPGNSGGPLIDANGNIIGVVTSKLNRQLAETANYAIKSDYLQFFLDQVDGFEPSKKETTDVKAEIGKLVKSYSKYIYIIESK